MPLHYLTCAYHYKFEIDAVARYTKTNTKTYKTAELQWKQYVYVHHGILSMASRTRTGIGRRKEAERRSIADTLGQGDGYFRTSAANGLLYKARREYLREGDSIQVQAQLMD